jgi:glyoxylase I family protein
VAAGPERAVEVMPAFAGVDHLSLTVTDLDVSERFYTDVLGFSVVVDFGTVRSLWHRPTGFFLSLTRHDGGSAARFSELNPGVDHIGLVATDREALEAWEGRFRRAGVEFTPIRDMPLGYHLNFRDPDGIALEFMAPNAVFTAALQELRDRDLSRAEIRVRAEELLGISLPLPST